MSDRPFVDLAALAWRAMRDRGLEPDFPADVQQQVARLHAPARTDEPGVQDLRRLPWFSIDNDDSRDLDQLSVAEPLAEGRTRVQVAIADVDALVQKGSPLDRHAGFNTTSVYTSARLFPMLPERLSTNLTSLNAHEDRLALVIAYCIEKDGSLTDPAVFRAAVRNRAQLTYDGVTAWLEGTAPPPPALERDAALPEQIHLHDAAAARLRVRRAEQGALDLETLETRAVMEENKVRGIRSTTQNRAQKIIEDVMIAANGVSAAFLQQRGSPSLRRVVRSPERWDRIERLAAEYGVTLPPDPDSHALSAFLQARKAADPLRFPDLSLAVVKMMGAGEYDVQVPGQDSPGHFGLAVRDYAHSTAPNRRYPDLLTHRLLKAALIAAPCPYPVSDLTALATHCTRQEDAANKVERQIRKSAAALLLRDHLGQTYDALVTGASPKGTYVRVLDPPVEGRVVEGYKGLDVGDRVRVRLTGVQVEQGFIDFTV